jgi:hypothetical protein
MASRLTRPRKLSRKELEELTPSKYLKEYFNIVLPPKIAEFWDRAGYVADDGLIDFEDVDGELVSGYWERFEGAPFFDNELAKYLSWYLFDKDPKYSITVCPAGAVCEIHEDDGYFEFVVYDTEKHEVIFIGTVMGSATWKEEAEDKTYVEFIPTGIVIEPLTT